MTIHHYLMQARKDDARRAGEQERVLLEARRLGLTRRPGAGLAALVTRGARLLSRWTRRTGWARASLGQQDSPGKQASLGKQARPTGEAQSVPD